MSRAEAHKLKSGTWRCKANFTIIDETGKKSYKQKSFTGKTKKEAELKADIFLNGEAATLKEPLKKTLGKIMDEFINSRTNLLSPSTIVGYEKIRNQAFPSIIDTPINDITSNIYQKAINDYAKEHGPKTVANAHMFAKSCFHVYDIKVADKTLLPAKKKVEKKIPEEAELQQFFREITKYRIYLPCMMGALMGLRWSEIIALQWKDIDFTTNKMSVNKARVRDKNNVFVIKEPKTTDSCRVLTIPKPVLDCLPERGKDEDFVIQGSVKSLYSQYQRVSKKEGFNYTFHAFRHFYASELVKKNLPIKYIMERMGHASPKMINEVYQHTFKTESDRIDRDVVDYFTSLMSDVKTE